MNDANMKGRIAGKCGSDSELILLNLIYDYPVRWSRYKVLRDFVQNFYDAVGYREWHRRFFYEIKDDCLFLKAMDIDFSYDWLIHIGASTKRDSPGEYAGYFGEGFKIASLCALRDYDWNIEMVSRDWELMVVTSQLPVDERLLTSLAYRVWKRDAESEDTILCVYPFDEEDEEVLEGVLLSFHYPQNPFFGKEIWSSRDAAIYYRSDYPKPRYFPSTYDASGRGIIYAGYQALGSFEYPLVFSLHGFRLDDRERSSFYKMDVVKVIKRTVRLMPAGPSFEVLEALKSRWYDRPKKQYDFETWYSIIALLVENIAHSGKHREAWIRKYPNLLVAQMVKRNDFRRYNRRRQALAWLRDSYVKYRMVQEAFSRLGYPTLEDVCEKHDGFSVVREPDEKEAVRIKLLEGLASLLMAEFLEGKDVEIPPCKIIKSERAVWSGMANCHTIKPSIPTSRNLRIRFRLSFVALKEKYLEKDRFADALSSYLHEMAHMFGSDGSASFSRALTELLHIVVEQSGVIEVFRKVWEGKMEMKGEEEDNRKEQ